MRPPFKIAGGKRHLASKILEQFPARVSAYFEPFLGGGAVFLAAEAAGRLASACPVVLADSDVHLIHLWATIASGAAALHKQVTQRVAGVVHAEDPKAAYNELRAEWNRGSIDPSLHLFLRLTAFNGLWRTNKCGEMNVPPRDRLRELAPPDLSNLVAVEAALWRTDAEFHGDDFRTFAHDTRIATGATVYLDPPYLGGFTQYTEDGFSAEDMADLLRLAAQWSARGARVIKSHIDTLEYRQLLQQCWPGACAVVVASRSSISRKTASRGTVSELLVCGGPT